MVAATSFPKFGFFFTTFIFHFVLVYSHHQFAMLWIYGLLGFAQNVSVFVHLFFEYDDMISRFVHIDLGTHI